MGVGMCCTMLPSWKQYFISGIVIGVVGIIGVIAAYPVYNHIVRRKRDKLAPEIMRLSEDISRAQGAAFCGTGARGRFQRNNTV